VRILVLSNFYPPHFIGGYELACQEMVDTLTQRGHKVSVLTSTYGVARRIQEGHVWRYLTTNVGWNIEQFPRYLFNLIRREVSSQRALSLLIRRFRPDVVYAWNLTHVSVSLCHRAQERKLPVCYYIFDNWLVEHSDPWHALMNHRPQRLYRRLSWRVVRSLLRQTDLLPGSTALDLRHAQFASQYLQNAALRAGKAVAGAKVIHWGVNLRRYPYKPTLTRGERLLYVGQIAPHKGVCTAIEALNLLVGEPSLSSLSLTIVGGISVTAYHNELRNLIVRFGLERKVTFAGQTPRENMANVYADHDILLFTSLWEEPFGITLLEAMASGIPVVSTATGGAAEIVEDGVNALVFPKGDPQACAASVKRLLQDARLLERIRVGGRRTAETRFRFEHTIDRIEQDLAVIAEASPLQSSQRFRSGDPPVS
jgi:glycosyltransferase involved in cell wall biosynthesis